MTVETVLNSKGRDVVTVAPDHSVAQAVEIIHTKRIGAVVVTGEGGAVMGIFSERDLIRGVAENGVAVVEQPVHTLMTELVHSCRVHHTVIDVMEMMTRRRIRHIPVLDDDDRLIGIVSIGDAVKARIAQTESEAEALKEYIATG